MEVAEPARLIDKLKQKYAGKIERDIDGVNIRAAEWHASVRPSNTEPYVRVNLEAKNKTALKAAEKELTEAIRDLNVK